MGKRNKKSIILITISILFLVSIVGGALILSIDKNAGIVKITNAYLSKYNTKLEGNVINVTENNKANSKGYDEVNYIITYNLSEEPGIDTRPVDLVATLDPNERYSVFKGTNQSGVRSELSTDMKTLTVHIENAKVLEQNSIQLTMLIQGAPNGYTVKPQIKIKEATEENYTNIEVATVEVVSNSLRGIVTDDKNMPVSNILVTLKKSGRLIKETYTKEDGSYSFSDIDKGTYEVLINEEIYEKANNKNVVVENDAELNIKVKKVEPYKIDTHKYITKLKLKNNGTEEVYNYGEVTLAQASIKKFKDISGEIHFKVTVENKGKKSGVVTLVKDELPEGLSFDETKNSGWELIDGVIYNRNLEGISLKANETREEYLILDIKNTDEARTYINKITAKGEVYEKVVFLINGTKYKEYEVLEGEKIKEPETGINNLDGWYTDSEYTNKYNFNNSVNKDLILYARTVTETCKVTFIDYGEIWDEQKIDCGTSPRRPSDPEHEGYDLKCWKTSNGCVDFDEPIDEDTVIESSYNIINYNITYNLNGGSLEEDKTNPSVYTVETDSFTLNNPSKLYYDFIGWTGSNGNNPEEIVTIEKGSTGNRNYTANYRKQKVTVKFIDKGEVISEEEIDKGSIIQSISVSKRGYTFKHWTKDNQNEFNFNEPIIENTTLYSVYELNTYNLTYNLDGGRLPEGLSNPSTYTVETETFTLINPSKEGYTFEGWTENDSDEAINPKAIEKGTIGNKELKAKYKIINYNITYELNGGALEEGKTNPSKYTVETDNFTLNKPSKTGYTFTGWTGTGLNEKTLEVTVPKGSTGNRSYEANYDINKYNVEFYNNDTLVDTQEYEYNSLINQETLPVVTKEGYTFTFWSLKNETTGYDFTIRVTKNIKLYSNFVKQKKEVIFNDENRITEVKVEWGEKVEPIASKGKEGYTFSYWSLTPNGEAFDFDTLITEPTTLYAVYNINTYNITYSLDGGEVTGNPDTYTIETNDFTLNNPSKTGYTFTGWTGTGLDEKTLEVTVLKGSTGNRSYEANYKKKKYTVKYIDKGSEYASDTVEYKDKTTAPETNPEKRGYTFSHWSLNENGEAFDFNTEIVSNTNLYSVYTINTYNLIYDLGGGSLGEGVTNPESYTVETDNFTLNNPSKEGYNFTGWNEEDSETISNPKTIEKGSIGNKKLIANYEVIEYRISYTLNDGILEHDNPTTYTIETDTFTLNNPSKTGYTFTGWTGTGLNEKTLEVTVPKGSTGDRNYEANFDRIYFDVSFYDKDPEDETSITQIGETLRIAYGEKVTEINHPEHTGFDPDGWLDGDNNRYSFDLPVTSNLTLTANYKKKKFDVIYIDEGEQYASYRVEYKDKATRPTDPDRSSEHKIFKEWLLNSEAYNFDTPVTTDIELVSSYDVVAVPSMSYSPTTWTNQAVIAEITSNYENYSYQYKVQGEDETYKNYSSDTKITVGSTGNCMPTSPCTVIAKSIYNNVSSETTSLDIENIERINPVIKNIEATSLDVDNATITIKTQDNESGMDYIKIYLNDIYQADISYTNNKQVDGDSSKTEEKISTYTFDNLESNTTYEVQIIAFDAAGNQTASEKVEFTTIEEEGVVAILIAVNNIPLDEITENEQFSKLKKAIEDPRCVSQQCTIQMVDNTAESVSVLDGQDITLDVNGHTIAGVRDYTIENTGLLTIVDNADIPGIITNSTGVALRNREDGVLTLGVNEENVTPSITAPSIYGGTLAVEKISGTFNFYDGRLEGTTSIYGIVDDTPYSYNASVATTETTQVTTLRQIEDPEARIGSTYYTKAQLAMDDARNGQQLKKTDLLSSFTNSSEYGFIYNEETKNLESNNNVVNTKATSTKEIDLSSYALDQTLYFTAKLQNGGTGTITVTELDSNNELISDLSTAESVTDEEKEITFKLVAGKKYVVTLEYNSPSENAEDSKMIVSNMVLTEYKEDLNKATSPQTAAIKNYGFRYDSETHDLKSDNQYVAPSRAFSYMEIDLTNETIKKDLLINTYLETYGNTSIYAYIIVDETLDIPNDSSYYPNNSDAVVGKINPSSNYNNSFIKVGSYNYIKTLDPGKKYYLSFVFQKSVYSNYPPQSAFVNNNNKDQFIIKSIDLVDSLEGGDIDLSTSLVDADDTDFEIKSDYNSYRWTDIDSTRTTDPDIQSKKAHAYVEVDLTNEPNDWSALVDMYFSYKANFYSVVTDSKELPDSTNAYANAIDYDNGINNGSNSRSVARLTGGVKNYIHFVYDIGEEVTGDYFYSPRISSIRLVKAVPYNLDGAFINYSGDNYVNKPVNNYASSNQSYTIANISSNSTNDSAILVDLTNSTSDQYMKLNVYFTYYNEKYIYITTDESLGNANHYYNNPKDTIVNFHYSNSPDSYQFNRNNIYSSSYIELDYILPKGNKYYIHFVTKWGTTSYDQTHDSMEINYVLLSPVSNHSIDIGELPLNKAPKESKAFGDIVLEDETSDKNMRYISASANNYISFNNELWRIIGVFNTEDADGNTARRLKIVRNESIGNYSWDGSHSGQYGTGTNIWSESDLMQLLNPGYDSETNGGSLYWNKQSGNCYAGDNSTTSCDFTNIGLSDNAKGFIDEVKWPVGMDLQPGNPNIIDFYNTTEKAATWIGKVGLPLFSDISFALDKQLPEGENTYSRETCITGGYGAAGACIATNNWYYNMTSPSSSNSIWTMTGSNMSPPSFLVFTINGAGGGNILYSTSTNKVYPTLFLSTKTYITGGKGTSGNPYTIELRTEDNVDSYYGLVDAGEDDEDEITWVHEDETEDYKNVITRPVYGFSYDAATKKYTNLNKNDPYSSAAIVFEFDMTNEVEVNDIILKFKQVSYASNDYRTKSFVNLYQGSFVPQDYTIVNYNDYSYGLIGDGYKSGTTSDSYNISLNPGSKYYLQVVFNTGAIGDTYEFSINGEKYNLEIKTYTPELNRDPDKVELLKDVTLENPLDIIDTKNVILDLNGHTITNRYNDYVVDNKGSLEIIDSKYINEAIQDEQVYQEELEKYESDLAIYNEYINSEQYIIDQTITNNFEYTGDVQTFTAPYTGKYSLEVWGASGGDSDTGVSTGGKGGYTYGEILLNQNDVLKVYVGGKGLNGKYGTIQTGGYNGGGNSGYYYGGSGGGATDIRITGDTLYNRIIVAGGGGGAGYYSSYNGGAGGGLQGLNGKGYSSYYAKGATQTEGGKYGGYMYSGVSGSFGNGGRAHNVSNTYSRSGGGGGGWYGGGGGGYYSNRTNYYYSVSGGGGGSGFAYDGTNTTPTNYNVGSYVLTNTRLLDGTYSMPSHDGNSIVTGNTGNGFAKITLIDEEKIEELYDGITTYDVKFEPTAPVKTDTIHNGKVYSSSYTSVLNEKNAYLEIDSSIIQTTAANFNGIENLGSTKVNKDGVVTALTNGIHSSATGDILDGEGYVSSFKIVNNDSFSGYNTGSINIDKNITVTANDINKDKSNIANVTVENGSTFNSNNSFLSVYSKESTVTNITDSKVSINNYGDSTITNSILYNSSSYNTNYNYKKITLDNVTGPSIASYYNSNTLEPTTIIKGGNIDNVQTRGTTTISNGFIGKELNITDDESVTNVSNSTISSSIINQGKFIGNNINIGNYKNTIGGVLNAVLSPNSILNNVTVTDGNIINENGTISINNGSMSSSTGETLDLDAIVINVNASVSIKGNFEINNYNVGIRSNTNSTLTLGNNEDAVDNNIIIRGNSTGIINEHVGTFNYYDGIIIAPKDNVIKTNINETPTDYDIDSSLDGNIKTVFLSRYDDENREAVARIGETEYKTLQHAFSAVNDSTNTTIELLKDIETLSKIEIPTERNITLNLSGKSINTYSGDLFTNNGNLSIEDNSLDSSSFVTVNGNSLINNKGTAIVNTNVNAGTPFNALLINSGELVISGGTYNIPYNDVDKRDYGSGLLPLGNYNGILKNTGHTVITYGEFNNPNVPLYGYSTDGYCGTINKCNLLYNEGTLDINDGIYNDDIRLYGTSNIAGGTLNKKLITNYRYNQDTSENIGSIVSITGGVFNDNIENSIYSNMTIDGITLPELFDSNNNSRNLQVTNNGTLTISESDIDRKVVNSKNLKIVSGNFTKQISNSRNLEIDDINIELDDTAIYANYTNPENINIIIKGGSIISNKNYAIIANGSITLGIDDDEIDIRPYISGVKTYGITTGSSLNMNFYDGYVRGRTAINGTVAIDNIPDGVEILTENETLTDESTIEIKYLGNASLLKNIRTEIEYDDFQTAINEAENGDTIQLLRTYILPSDLETIQVGSSKDINIDFNGYSLSKQNANLFINNEGKLHLYSNAKVVTIASAYKTNFIDNSGTLLIERVDFTNANGSITTPNVLINNSNNLEMSRVHISGYGNDNLINNTGNMIMFMSGATGYDNNNTIINSGTLKAYGSNASSSKSTAINNSGEMSFEPVYLYFYDKSDDVNALKSYLVANECTKTNGIFTCKYENVNLNTKYFNYCYEKNGDVECELKKFEDMIGGTYTDYYFGDFTITGSDNTYHITYSNPIDILNINRDALVFNVAYGIDSYVYGSSYDASTGEHIDPDLIINTNKLVFRKTEIESYGLNKVINSNGILDVRFSSIIESPNATNIWYNVYNTSPMSRNITDMMELRGESTFYDTTISRTSTANNTRFNFNSFNGGTNIWTIDSSGKLDMNKVKMTSRLNGGINTNYSTSIVNINNSNISVGYPSRDYNPYKSDRYGIVAGGTLNLTNTNIDALIPTVEFRGTNLTINGGTFESGGYGYYQENKLTQTPAIALLTGTTNFIDGKVNSKYGIGISVSDNATLNVGTNDGNVSITKPEVSATLNTSLRGKWPALSSSGIVNFYDGVFKAETPIKGKVTTIENGYQIIKDGDSKYLSNVDLVENSRTGEKYSDFNSAISNASNGDTLEMLREFTQLSSDNAITIPNNLEITIDLGGNKYLGNSNDSIINNGTLNLINGTVISTSDYFITNNGTLNLGDDNNTLNVSDSKILNNSTGTFNNKATELDTVINNGIFSHINGTLHKLSNNSGTANVTGGTINIDNNNYSVENYSTLNITGGTITNSCANNDSYCIEKALLNESGAEVNITGDTALINKIITNNGDLNVNNYCNNSSSNCILDVKTNNGDVEIYDSKINTINIDNSGSVLINNSSLQFIGGGITNNGSITIENNSELKDLVTSCNANISNSLVHNLTNNCSDKSLISLSNATIDTFTNNGSVVLNGNSIGKINTTYDSNIELISGTVTGGITNKGTLVIGEIGGTVSTTNPSISGPEFGLTTEAQGHTYFYDGIISGSPLSISGDIDEVEPGYTIKYNLDTETNIQSATLKVIGPDDVRIAVVAGLNFDKLQSAVNYAANNDINAITLYADITLDSDLVIPAGKTATIYLNGYTITENGFTIDSNITVSSDSSPAGASILGSILGTVSKNIIIYEMEDGTMLSPERSYKLYKLDGSEYNLVKMKREEEIGRYTPGNKDINMKTVRSRIYLKDLSEGNYKLKDDKGKEITFVIDENGLISSNVLEYYDTNTNGKVESSAVATLILSIQTGITRINFILLLIIILAAIFILFKLKSNKLKNSKEEA